MRNEPRSKMCLFEWVGFCVVLMMLAGLGKSMAAEQVRRGGAASRRSAFVPMDFKKVFSAGPLSEPQPPSTLLPAGATSFTLTLRSATPTVCRYSVGEDKPFDAMTPFDALEVSTAPRTLIRGLDSDPDKVNEVTIRCAAAPEAALHLQYRCLPRVKPGYPRTGNLWGSGNYRSKGLAYAAHIDLWLGASFSVEQVRELRRLNPNCLILTSINTVENNDVPDDYYLRDTTGSKIEVWPGAWRLNLTRPEVAEYQARYAYQKMLESGLRYDGCFFDNFMMSQSWQNHDIYGRPAQIDADGDGKADEAKKLDAAWRAGVFHELRTWRALMPWALTTGHSQGYPTPEIGEIFNGQGVGFYTTDVIEGKKSFAWLWDYYRAWNKNTVKPAITFVESAVPDQIAYGYDYSPQEKMPPATLAFARDYYPYMRFGLAFTLMSDGYFGHEIGDTHHGQDWWYDELDFKLGAPMGEARAVAVRNVAGEAEKELIVNGGFEEGVEKGWSLWANTAAGSQATAARDTSVKRDGAAAARITITATGARGRQVEFTQRGRALTAGKTYELKFWARADKKRMLTAAATKGSPNWDNYGLSGEVELSGQWEEFDLVFEANRTAGDVRIQFLCGAATGTVWLDDVRLSEHAPEVLRRDFERGVALLNPTRQIQKVALGPGLARLKGEQAPRYQYILDDAGKEFSATGAWGVVELNTPEWKALAPFYHAWDAKCHKLAGGAGEARWDLALRGAGTYTIQAWWPAAPEATTTTTGAGWTRQAVYELVAGGKVLASQTFDQTQTGDQWHTIAEGVKLAPGDKPFVRLKAAGAGALIADALHVFSAERYNDGSPASEVSLEPMDGIVLRKVDNEER